jgi:predicted RNA-binding Zn-ribbon protein involved in translation (DUF1610 family)
MATQETRARGGWIERSQVFCPSCGQALVYRKTIASADGETERLHYFACPNCGAFEYRSRNEPDAC